MQTIKAAATAQKNTKEVSSFLKYTTEAYRGDEEQSRLVDWLNSIYFFPHALARSLRLADANRIKMQKCYVCVGVSATATRLNCELRCCLHNRMNHCIVNMFVFLSHTHTHILFFMRRILFFIFLFFALLFFPGVDQGNERE